MITPHDPPRTDLDDWLASLAHSRRLSPRTLVAYRRDIERLLTHLAAAGIAEPAAAGTQDLRRVLAGLHRAGLGGRSLQRWLSAVRGFYQHLQKRGLIVANPAAQLRAPRAPRRLPGTLDTDEAGRLMAIPGHSPLARRDRAMVELFYSSALRLAELAGLQWCDIDRDNALVRILGKGQKTRIVPVGRHALAALDAWRADHEQLAGAGVGAVFVGRHGRPLGGRAIQLRLAHWGRVLGLDRRIHPHLLRHSAASHLLESSGDLRAVQEFLGHTSLATTQIYTHLDFQHLVKVYDQAHPRARRRRE